MIGFSAAVGRVGPISRSSTSDKLRSDNSLGDISLTGPLIVIWK